MLSAERQQQPSTSEETNNGNQGSSSFMWLPTLVLPLLLVYISNQWSRSSIYYLVDFDAGADAFTAMNVAIGFTEAQYGLLASLAFTALFAIASLGAGLAADRYNRKTLTMVAATGWSLATIGTAMSTTYGQVLTWRIAMGLFCAFSTPTAYTLINQKVPSDKKSLATSVYGTGVAFGGALASLSILLDNQFGWQQAMLVIGGVGFASAAIVFLFLPDDDKSNRNIQPEIDTKGSVEEPASFLADFAKALSTNRAKWIFLGSFLRFSSGLCIGVWSAPFFRMTFPDNAGNYAVSQAFITAVAGSTSGLIGGATADYLSSKVSGSKNENPSVDSNGVRLWVPVVGSLLAAPSWYLATHAADSFQVAMIWLSVEYLVAECWFGPTISTLLSTVPSKVGGTAQGMFTLTGGIANIAPTALGYFYGQLTTGQESSSELQSLLSAVVCFGYISSAICFALGAQSPPPEVTTSSRVKAS
ncbi:major facilitator superfamily transporter [Nitzschia inconspicua]|uniref:Major facilitator superfamily transporter n=1 Tax=Nitzschia inconspicua TaxID=303405 RepID=A0A9K3LZL9_9STRA|nr:major facilitator superfamily transporter [Nitzschia inconspicua]